MGIVKRSTARVVQTKGLNPRFCWAVDWEIESEF